VGGRLAPALLRALDGLRAQGSLVVLDFDGTLAPIRANRAGVRLTPRTLRALEALARRHPVAVLSGRAAADVSARLADLGVAFVIGSHGAEWPGEARAHPGWRRQVRGWSLALRSGLSRLPGVAVEEKPLSVAVHFRGARAPRAAEAHILDLAGGLRGARVIPGKRVVNLVPRGAGDKGTALARLVRLTRARRVLFVGDDVTDEAAFAATLPVPLVSVRVGRTARTAARHSLSRRADVDLLLERLAGPGPNVRATRARARESSSRIHPT
jgi:trehalose 6-phosphate phosphatase